MNHQRVKILVVFIGFKNLEIIFLETLQIKTSKATGPWWSSGLERQSHDVIDHAQGRGFESGSISRSFLSVK